MPPTIERLLEDLETGLTLGTRQGLWQSSRAAEDLQALLSPPQEVPPGEVGQWNALHRKLSRCQTLCLSGSEFLDHYSNNLNGECSPGIRDSTGWEA